MESGFPLLISSENHLLLIRVHFHGKNMKKRINSLFKVAIAMSAVLAVGIGVCAQEKHSRTDGHQRSFGGIHWYSTLDSGLAAASKTGRPILFLSAAPHCGGVSGVW